MIILLEKVGYTCCTMILGVISGYFGHNVEKVAKEDIGYFGQFLLETAASIVHIL